MSHFALSHNIIFEYLNEQIEGATVGREFELIIFVLKKEISFDISFLMAGKTRLELATSCVTGMRSNQTELRSHLRVRTFYYKQNNFASIFFPITNFIFRHVKTI